MAGVALRLAFVPAPGYEADVRALISWAEALVRFGPGSLYDPGVLPLYPPLYPPLGMAILGALGSAFDGEPLRLALKAASIPADIGIALVAWAWMRRRAGERRALACAAIWLLSPPVIFAGAYWGQLDAYGTLPVLAALLAAGTRRWGVAGLLCGLALMVKPQFGLGALVVGAAALSEGLRTRTGRAPARFAGGALAGVIPLAVAFGTDPTELLELVRRGTESYPFASLFAFNIWAIGQPFMTLDRSFGIGALLLSLGLVASVVPLWWRRDGWTMLLCGGLAALAFYFLPTRAHERYLYPALAYLLPLAVLRWQVVLPYLLLTAGCFASFYAPFVSVGLITLPPPWDALARDRNAHVALAWSMIGTAAVLAGSLVLAWRRAAFPGPRVRARASPPAISFLASFARSAAAAARRGVPEEALRSILVLVIAVKVAGMIAAFSPSGLSAFDLPKTAWSRAAMWLLLGPLLVLLARRGARPRLTPLDAAVAAFVLANVLATLFAEHAYTALFGERNRYLGLTFVLDMAVLYVAASVALRRTRDWIALATGLAVAAVLALGYGIIQALGLDPRGWAEAARIRPFSTFGNPDMFGHFLGAVASAGAAIALFAGDRRARLAAGALASIAAALIAFVATRGALVGVAAGAVVLLALYLVAARGRANVAPRLVAAATAAAVVLLLVLLATPLGARLGSAFTGSEATDRLVIYEASARAVLLRPVLGFGPDSLGLAFPQVRRAGTEAAHQGAVLVDQAHNWVLQTLVTTGVVGLAALLAVIALSARALCRAFARAPARAAALLAAGAAYFGHGLVAVDAVSVSWLPWLIAGCAAALVPRPPQAPPGTRPLPLVAVVLLGAIVLALSGVAAVQANEAAWRASEAYRQGDATATTAAANEAIAWDPGRGEYWNYRGLGRGLRALYAIAAADHEEAALRTPHQTNYLANLARARTAQALAGDLSGGGAAAAYVAARRAIAVDPNLSTPHRTLAEVALAFDDADLALNEAVTAIRLHPANGTADAIAATAAARHPDKQRARALLRSALEVRRSPVLEAALRGLGS